MKKNEIVMVRVLTLAGMLALSFFVLTFLVGGGEFSKIVSNMNNNVYDITGKDGSIYNLYFYKGLGNIYEVLFSLSLLFSVVGAIGIILKSNNTGVVALFAGIINTLTGVYLLIVRLLEGSAGLHVFIDSFYMDDINKSEIETTQLLDRIPILYILLVILGLIEIFMVFSSRIQNLKIYKKTGSCNAILVVIPSIYGYLFFDVIRGFYMSSSTKSIGGKVSAAFDYLTDYYIGSKFLFGWSFMTLFVVVGVIAILEREILGKKVNRQLKALITIGLPATIIVIASVVFANNPPALFGYLTLDVELCDIVDSGFNAYLVAFSVSVILAFIWIYSAVNNYLDVRGFCIVAVINIIISVLLFMIMKGKESLSTMYIAWIVADIITLVATAGMIFFKKSKKNI